MSSNPIDEQALREKQAKLRAILLGMERVAIAFSGGVDSSYLLAAALDALGSERVIALTADSPLLPREELRSAHAVAELLGAPLHVLPSDDLAVPQVAANERLRCYHCKRTRFAALRVIAQQYGDAQLLHGENADDLQMHRPGSAAAHELGVRAPLAEAGLTKAEIRELSRRRGLPTWDHPAASCLATRFPYDIRLTPEALARVEQAEGALRALLGAQQLRVRDHGDIARIELSAEALGRIVEEPVREALVERLRALGYRYVTLDLAGYHTGSFDV